MAALLLVTHIATFAVSFAGFIGYSGIAPITSDCDMLRAVAAAAAAAAKH